MQRIAQFEKVSLEQFLSTCPEGKEAYEKLELPQRATSGSAGYDFYMPYDLTLAPGQTALIPTGIRARMQDGWVLCLFPRSGLGFKFRMQLNNTVGIIDADYYHSDNEGHIQAKITNDSRENKVLELKQGQGFMQGIFLPFGITEDDEVNTIRNGGFGSTTQ
ncbi:MAG TPA: deoxyuridine 5'-triphosphate nucleotidohydrolase [Candidatus Fimiplasma intestinipullorum]|uniref:dUTP diphosphatase n=1 Tax=Candidatus Fimiplasma intestinipullorum TaxID=2840825 RepID=A0A9D1HM13_9FIRM|nr:deoxyuridine 5'-triphosphate nucleotidohydrolase [Candidatus Fimiplasma intestinipullorum]